jgi:hypothetical protein
MGVKTNSATYACMFQFGYRQKWRRLAKVANLLALINQI